MLRKIIVIKFIFLMFCIQSHAADTCADRLFGYNIYEELENGKISEKYSKFEIELWSQHSTFEGFLVSKQEDPDTLVEIELRKNKNGKTWKIKQWGFKPWDFDKNFYSTQITNEEINAFFQDPKQKKTAYFVLRLKNNDKILCENLPIKALFSGD